MRYRLIFLGLALGAFSPPSLLAASCFDAYHKLGNSYDPASHTLRFRTYSENATSVEVELFKQSRGETGVRFPLKNVGGNVWEITLTTQELVSRGLLAKEPGDRIDQFLYYGYRADGPVGKGNRYSPSKLLLDPWALETSHDPVQKDSKEWEAYLTGPHAAIDSGPVAPKGVVMNPLPGSPTPGPEHSLKDDIIYEVHVRGFTKNDQKLPTEWQGTYRGAAEKAKYLKELGVTAVEFLPIQETQNDQNRADGSAGSNYWGYMTLNYFSPDRRYATEASRQQVGGVTKEFRDMVDAYHGEGLKVFLDIVYNHTIEDFPFGSDLEITKQLSFRGLDNKVYYQVGSDPRRYKDNNGCGPNFNCGHPHVREFILANLQYWRSLGVDGFRFDLGPMLGNLVIEGDHFHFDKMPPASALNRSIVELPARPDQGGHGVDLMAESWATGDGNNYQQGGFPYHPDKRAGYAEWNGKYRDEIRLAVKEGAAPAVVANRIAGSQDLFRDDGRKPLHSINIIATHDGFTFSDLTSTNHKRNEQPYPFGPSSGGEDNNHSSDHARHGDTPESRARLQQQVERTLFAIPLLSFSPTLFPGGTEMRRTQGHNNNMYNLDNDKNWLDWALLDTEAAHFQFAKRAIAFRHAHPALRPAEYFNGHDNNGNGLRDISWHPPDGSSAEDRDQPPGSPSYMNQHHNGFLGYRIDAEEAGEHGVRSIYVAFNYGHGRETISLPSPAEGRQWYLAGDTSSAFASEGYWKEVGQELPLNQVLESRGVDGRYPMEDVSAAIFVER